MSSAATAGEHKDSRKLYVHTKRKLNNLRDVPVQQKVEDYRKKQIDKFNKKHSKLLATYKESDKMRWHADKQIEKAEIRIAQKYGYISWRHRGSVRRSS